MKDEKALALDKLAENELELGIQMQPDAHLFYAPGDVLICKESGEKATVVNGNTGPLQLANGKIALQWADEVYGEYTLAQIMDGFIRQVEPKPEGCAECGKSSTEDSMVALYCVSCWDKASPPKREWQGLTDEERFELAVQTGAMTADWLTFMEAVEAKLKERNT